MVKKKKKKQAFFKLEESGDEGLEVRINGDVIDISTMFVTAMEKDPKIAELMAVSLDIFRSRIMSNDTKND